jgi:AhpD family alkylhydroperoxidase
MSKNIGQFMSKNSNGFTRRIYHSPGELISAVSEILRTSSDYKSALKSGRISHAFAEKIMLAVTRVNECRYCLYAHSRAALKAGVPEEEQNAIASGDMGYLPLEEAPALIYAQHYAESGGAPEPGEFRSLVDFYGEQTALEIAAYIRMIMVGNLLGNTFDALLSRIQRRPAPDSSLVSELGTLFVAVVGAIPFGIVFAFRLL